MTKMLYVKKECSSYETLYMMEGDGYHPLSGCTGYNLRVSLPGTKTEIVEEWREATDREIAIYEMMVAKEK